MNREQFVAQFSAYCDKMKTIMIAKNADYSGASEDPFANFTIVERTGICSPETGFLTRMSDKFSRIATFVKKGALKVKDESVEDTLIDLANYSLLLACYIKSKRPGVTSVSASLDAVALALAANPRLPFDHHQTRLFDGFPCPE